MNLSTWVAVNEINRKQMAKDLGIGYEWLCRIIVKSHKPSIKLALQIEHYTKGKVTCEDLLGDVINTPAYKWIAEITNRQGS